ncbi:MAG: hypothetical protein ACLQNE_27600 [Thermoguttaceae bacterium]
MSKRQRKRRPSAPSRFKVGDCVRVKPGIRDDDYPDMPLGGWAGKISEVGKRGTYSVRWSPKTLASIHPICKKRSAIDGTVLEEHWLGEDDLEPDPGGPPAIEQPTHIMPRPLSAENQGDRVRMVFGLTSDDFLPAVDRDSLETYYDHLAKELSLPVEARYCPQAEFFNPSLLRSVIVTSLDREVAWDEDQGILCRIRTADGEEVVPLKGLRLHRSDPNFQRVDDFAAWFVGELLEEMEGDEDEDIEEDDDEDTEEDDEVDEGDDAEEVSSVPKEANRRSTLLELLNIVAFAASYGAIMGAAVTAVPWARWAACIGGGVWSVVAAVAQTRFSRWNRIRMSPKLRKGLGVVAGLITGAFHGALFGVMVVAFLGAVLGCIVGLLCRRLVRGRNWLILRIFPEGLLFPAACGVVAQAFYRDRTAAANGLGYGALIGLGLGLFLCLIVLPLVFLILRRNAR